MNAKAKKIEVIPGVTYQNALHSKWKVVRICGNGRIECEIQSSKGASVTIYMRRADFASMTPV